MARFYKGFSTRRYEDSGGNFEIYNIDCVVEDLTNEIFTIKGERLMMPTYGTRIPLLTFEPNDAATLDVVREDIKSVIDHDPRVELIELNVWSAHDRNVILAHAQIKYKEFNVTQDLAITVNSR